MGFIGEAWSWLTRKAGSGNSGSSTNSTSTPKPSLTLSPAPIYQSTPTNKQQVQQSFQQSVYSGGSDGGYTPPLTGGSSGGSSKTNSPSSPGLITQSTPSNKIQVQQQLRNVGAVNAATQKAQNYINTQLGSIMNLGQLSDVAYSNVINPIYNRANQIYQNELNKYYKRQPPISGLPTQSRALNLTKGNTTLKAALVPYSQVNKTGNQTQEVVNMFDPKTYMNLVNALQQDAKNTNANANLKSTLKKLIEQPLIASSSFVGYSWDALKSLPLSALSLIKNPANLKKVIPNAIADAGNTIQLLKNPNTMGQAVGKIGSYVFVGKIIDGAFKITGQVTKTAATKLSPKFVGEAKTGITLKIPDSAKPGISKNLNLKVVDSIPKESLAAQVKRAGTMGNAISSQANGIVGLIKRAKIIRKPIPGEKALPSPTKSLLKKFDSGNIKAAELIKLDTQLRRLGKKGILERSFFADPNLRIRPSRLGIKPNNEGNLLDLLSGRASLKGSKPQILLFKNIKIQDLPKSLRDIKSALRSGKALTKSQTERLLRWQQQTSGQFKPIGFVTRESEITLAPGEVIRRVKKVGVTLVDGKRVPIIEAKVVKAAGKVKTLLKKVQTGKATAKEIKSLQKALKKQTGFKYSSSSIKDLKLKYPAGRKLLSATSSAVARTISIKRKDVQYASNGRPYVKTFSGVRFISPSSVPKGSSSNQITISSVPRSPAKSSPKSSSPISRPKVVGKSSYGGYYSRYKSKLSTKKIVSGRPEVKPSPSAKSSGAFNVYAKSGKRFVRLNKKPLSGIDAISKGRYVVDNTTSASFKIVPTKKVKKLGKIPAYEKAYARKVDNKFRDYKIRYGRRKASEVIIEKRGYRMDTSGEKRGLTLAKYLKQQARGSVRKKPSASRQVSRKVMMPARITATPSRKPAAYSSSRITKRPAYMVKGSAAAKQRMAQLRAMR